MKTATITKPGVENNTLTRVENAVVRTLLYFHIFKHPLSAPEIFENCHKEAFSQGEIAMALNALRIKGFIDEQKGYFYIGEDGSIVERRIKGSVTAEKHMKVARRFSRLISFFPFVEAVMVSGSLAKGYSDKESDIDYFIITRPGRLWLTRTALIAFKKLVLLNSKKYFCVNYFIDSSNIEIPDKNIFTATELVFIKPMYNKVLCEAFVAANDWSARFYPNKQIEFGEIPESNQPLLKKIAERLLNGKIGTKIDEWCFKTTLNHWKKKFKEFDDSVFDLNLRSRKNVSKHHPRGFQLKVLEEFQKNILTFENNFGLVIS